MFPFLLLSYFLGKNSAKDTYITTGAATDGTNKEKSVAKNVYNYNYLDNSNTGNTLFGSQKKTKRTLFGSDELVSA